MSCVGNDRGKIRGEPVQGFLLMHMSEALRSTYAVHSCFTCCLWSGISLGNDDDDDDDDDDHGGKQTDGRTDRQSIRTNATSYREALRRPHNMYSNINWNKLHLLRLEYVAWWPPVRRVETQVPFYSLYGPKYISLCHNMSETLQLAMPFQYIVKTFAKKLQNCETET